MEHEVNVPFSVGPVRAALSEPERVARCVPGLQPDGAASADGTIEGRLRVRVGNSTITYRGSLSVTSDGEEFTVKGRGTEARGSGSVRLDLAVVPRRAKDGEGTRLVCSGTVKGDGRIKDVEQKTATTAGHRLLERFGKALGESIHEDPPGALDAPDAPSAEPATSEPASPESAPAESASSEPAAAGPVGGIGEPGDNDRVIPGIPGPDSRESQSGAAEKSGDQAGAAAGRTGGEEAAGSEDESRPADKADEEREEPGEGTRDEQPGRRPPEREGVFETEVPPPSLDPLQDEEPLDEAEVEAAAEAEAAHARRTMIGRSAEEVDHAPPRGRYAPVPLPEPIANSAALRWVAPAAAAAVAGAVFVGRLLRRRR